MIETGQRNMLIPRRAYSLCLAGVAVLLGTTACRSLIGIEDIHEEPVSGSAGMAGRDSSSGGGRGGNQPGAGSSNSAGSIATAGKGGGNSNGGSSGGDPRGGAGPEAGAAGVAGLAGSGSTVQGHVIDYWGHRLADVAIELDGETSTTDGQGAFQFEAAPTEYDISLVVSYNVNGRIKTRAWVYQGLTRRDPTLQIYEGMMYKDAPLDIIPNHPSTLTDARTLSVALGGPDGSAERTDVTGAGYDGTTITWEGPDTTQETAHALIWEKDVNSGFPSQYVAFDSTLVALSDSATAHGKASFDLSADTIASGTIVGSVLGSGFVARFNNVFLRYTSNAVMQLLSDTPQANGFSYLVPNIPNATATLVAGDGDVYTELGVVHKDGLAPNTAGLSVTIPTPARNLTVAPTTDLGKVSATTQFSFKPGGTANAPFVAWFSNQDVSNHDDVLYVVSAKAPFKLPKVVNGTYALLPGGVYTWRIETHGSPASVDAMVGPTGFLDSLSAADNADAPSGPRTGDGSYTLSKSVQLTVAP